MGDGGEAPSIPRRSGRDHSRWEHAWWAGGETAMARSQVWRALGTRCPRDQEHDRFVWAVQTRGASAPCRPPHAAPARASRGIHGC